MHEPARPTTQREGSAIIPSEANAHERVIPQRLTRSDFRCDRNSLLFERQPDPIGRIQARILNASLGSR
jgi:hypothetical protein